MRVLFFFILSIISVCYVQSALPQCVMCMYRGANDKGKFNLEDVPKRCEAILYGGNFFNMEPPKADTDAITGLKKAGKPVYMMYLYGNDDAGANLLELANPNNTLKLEEYMAPMITYLKNNNIDGVFFAYLDFTNGLRAGYDTGVKDLLVKTKKLLPSIKVGIIIPGYQCEHWNKKEVFDFSVTNTDVDIYMIDATSAGATCDAKTTSAGGRYPIKSDNPRVASLDNICTGVSNSPMDKNKVMVNLAVSATKETSSSGENMAYSDYCRRNPKELWCADNMKIMYDEVTFLKNLFKGIMLSFMDYDDMDNVCKCGKYPVTNNYIDAWEKKPITCCDAIS